MAEPTIEYVDQQDITGKVLRVIEDEVDAIYGGLAADVWRTLAVHTFNDDLTNFDCEHTEANQ